MRGLAAPRSHWHATPAAGPFADSDPRANWYEVSMDLPMRPLAVPPPATDRATWLAFARPLRPPTGRPPAYWAGQQLLGLGDGGNERTEINESHVASYGDSSGRRPSKGARRATTTRHGRRAR